MDPKAPSIVEDATQKPHAPPGFPPGNSVQEQVDWLLQHYPPWEEDKDVIGAVSRDYPYQLPLYLANALCER